MLDRGRKEDGAGAEEDWEGEGDERTIARNWDGSGKTAVVAPEA